MKASDMTILPAPRRDTACFSHMQWFVGDCPFSSLEDATNAIKLAERHADAKLREYSANVRSAVDNIL